MRAVVEVEVWSDVVCPWCYIGKQRFERAVAQVSDDIDVRFVYRPYQLDPRAPLGEPTPVAEAYAKKFGGPERASQIIDHVTSIAAAEGIEFHLDRALRANTLLAHRLLWLAEATGQQHQLKDRLLRAYFEDGLDIGDADVLASCAREVGMNEARVRAFLATDDGTNEVRALMAAAVEHEISAVPTYVISPPGVEPAWLVPGAQDTDVFVNVLRRSAQRSLLAESHDEARG
jgi:predicted DsbA family dithiol-disulfide isomerase